MSLSITSNISKCPDCLLADVLVGGCDQVNKGRNGSTLHNSTSLIRCSRGNVCQSPGCLKLDGRAVWQSKEAHKLGDETCADHLVNRRMFFTRQQFPAFKMAQGLLSIVFPSFLSPPHFLCDMLPCSLCGLELGLTMTTIHPCDNLFNCPLPQSL